MYKKQVPPPYVPEVKGAEDASNFEDAFTKMTPKDTPSNVPLESYQKDYFDGFTFEGNEDGIPPNN